MEDLKTYETVMIPLSNGKEQEFAIMDEFDFEEKHYIVVSPVKEDEIQEGCYLYQSTESDGELEISQIEDSETFARAADYFEKRQA